jgi:type III secretory pathway component EscR
MLPPSLGCSCCVLVLLHNNDNPEKQAQLGTQDKRQTKQNKNTIVVFLFCFVCLLSCVPSVACFSGLSLLCSCFVCLCLLSCVPNVACSTRTTQRSRQHWVHKTKDKQNKTRTQQEQLQRNRQHWVHKTIDKDKQNKTRTQQEQPREAGNIGYTRQKTKTNKTKQGQLQRNRQHWVHKTKDNQNKTKTQQEQPIETGNIFYVCLCLLSCVPNVACFSGLSLLCSCFVCLCLLPCVPNVACFSGLSNKTKQGHNKDNPEKQAQLGTQDKRQRQTKQEHNKVNYRDEQPALQQNLGVNPGTREG